VCPLPRRWTSMRRRRLRRAEPSSSRCSTKHSGRRARPRAAG
jgi:hypothetical protein